MVGETVDAGATSFEADNHDRRSDARSKLPRHTPTLSEDRWHQRFVRHLDTLANPCGAYPRRGNRYLPLQLKAPLCPDRPCTSG